jgi:phosphoribosyl-dephospho-CoA transferase
MDDMQAAAVHRWTTNAFPLVVCRQPCNVLADDMFSAGLPGPLALGRGRWVFRIRADDVLWFDEFPLAADVTPLIPASAREQWMLLCERLAALDVCARVYGSYGWQQLTGLTYVRECSDLDLYLPVRNATHADEVVWLLATAHASLPRLDGEVVLPEGMGIAWREWADWRCGRVRELLVKQLHSVRLLNPHTSRDLLCL